MTVRYLFVFQAMSMAFLGNVLKTTVCLADMWISVCISALHYACPWYIELMQHLLN